MNRMQNLHVSAAKIAMYGNLAIARMLKKPTTLNDRLQRHCFAEPKISKFWITYWIKHCDVRATLRQLHRGTAYECNCVASLHVATTKAFRAWPRVQASLTIGYFLSFHAKTAGKNWGLQGVRAMCKYLCKSYNVGPTETAHWDTGHCATPCREPLAARLISHCWLRRQHRGNNRKGTDCRTHLKSPRLKDMKRHKTHIVLNFILRLAQCTCD